MDKQRWIKSETLNILSPENLGKINHSFEIGFIFGLLYHYYGGSSASRWACTDYAEFMKLVSLSRPGDLYVIWSTKELESKGLMIACGDYSETNLKLISEDDLQNVKNYLSNKGNECFVIFLAPNLPYPETKMYELDEMISDLIDDIENFCTTPGGKIYIFPYTDIDRKEHILVEAKRTNEKGEVPIGGAY